MLLKNAGVTYSQLDAYNLSDYVNSLSRFISVTPEDLMIKIESAIPKEMKHITGGFYDIFEINANSVDADRIKDAFSSNFKRLVHENNSRMPIIYRVMNIFSRPDENGKKYGDRKADEKIDYLATLRFWRIEPNVFSRIHK